MLTTILTVLAVALAVARRLAPHAVRLLGLSSVPPAWARWAWLPQAVVAALALTVARLAALTGGSEAVPDGALQWLELLDIALQVAVVVEGFYQRGHAPPPSDLTRYAEAVRLPGGRVPPTLGSMLVLLVAALLTGCAGSLEAARADGLSARASVAAAGPSEPDRGRCTQLDRKRATWAAVAAGAAVLAGGSGLSSIPAPTEGAQVGLASGAVVALAVAGAAEVASQRAAESWARECSGGQP